MPFPEMRNVQSSKVFQIGYDADARDFYVRFVPNARHPAGRIAVYRGVPPDIAASIEAAPSIGTALKQFVEGIYPFSYA